MTTASVLPARYKINGLIDTSQNVMQNLTALATSAGTFIGYDVHEGKWSVIINRASSSVKSFNDANIVGAMQVNGTGLDELYNSVTIEFPLRDTADAMDIIKITIPAGDRNPNEPDNDLQIRLDQVNEPVQAEIIGLIELKQARLDMIVTFDADYTAVSVNAGDVIDISNSVYGWSNKLFRVITMEEIDDEVGNLYFRLTCLEYDANVYDTSDIGRYIRQDSTGIKAIGAIGTPITPVIYDFDYDQRPGILVETVVPSGVVENMEFWLSSDNTNFTLIGTVPPLGGGTFTSGTTVTLDYDQLDNQNVYVKTRGMNSTTTGPFSTAAVLSAFAPVQVTGAINQATNVLDASNNSLLGLTTANLLIAAIKALIDDSSAASGGIFSQTMQVFQDQTGVALTGQTFYAVVTTEVSEATSLSQCQAMLNTGYPYGVYNPANSLARANSINAAVATLPAGYDSLEIEVRTPTFIMDYDFKDSSGNIRTESVFAQPPFKVQLLRGNSLATATLLTENTVDWTSNFAKISYPAPSAGTYWVALNLIPTYDLNAYWTGRTGAQNNEIFFYNFTTSGTSSKTFFSTAAISN